MLPLFLDPLGEIRMVRLCGDSPRTQILRHRLTIVLGVTVDQTFSSPAAARGDDGGELAQGVRSLVRCPYDGEVEIAPSEITPDHSALFDVEGGGYTA